MSYPGTTGDFYYCCNSTDLAAFATSVSDRAAIFFKQHLWGEIKQGWDQVLSAYRHTAAAFS